MDETTAKQEGSRPVLWKIEEGLCYFSLACLVFIPLADTFLRHGFNSRFPAAPPLMSHLLLVLGLLSGMITTRTGDHLSIGLFQFFNNRKLQTAVTAASALASAFLVTIFGWCSASFIRVGLYPVQMVGFIPDRVFALVMPIGYGVIAFRFARRTGLHGKARVLPVLALILGTLVSLPAIFKLLWGLDLPDFAWDLTDMFRGLAELLRMPIVIILGILAVIGTPIFVVIGGFSLIFLQSSWGEIDIVASQIYTALTQTSLTAIPLFTLTGFILSESKAGERLVETFKSFFGWIPGGTIIVTVILCAFFTSFTGASGVTILALGGILLTVLSPYPEKFAIGILTASGSIGLLFPPSLPILLVGAATRTNTIHLFLGGLLPGLLLVAATIIFGITISVKNKIPVERFSLKRAGRGLKQSFLELLLPLVLIAGYFTGAFSLVELSAVAVLYVFITEVFIYREITPKKIVTVFARTVPIVGGILSILALAQALSYYILDSRIPVIFADWMQNAVSSKWVFLLLLNLALLITGCLIDIFSAIMIILPLLAPLGAVYGIDPVHLGIIFLINMEAGFLTPPVGLNLFLASYRFKKPFVNIARNVFPFLVIQLAVVLIVTYIPALSTFLKGFF
ncbi:MAG: TRAP transporter large permease subunit [Treponema sp.]|jgi:tripartite ATP-independent transporter DctM subunit|nr:TRAP transporter large permease subunit [Treponema sp.]